MTATEQLQGLLAHADDPKLEPYHVEPLRFSRLKLIGKSAAHFRHAPNPSGSGLDIGSAAHSIVLGGRPVIFFPGKTRQGKAWDEFQVEHDDAIILTRREHGIAEGMAKSVQASPDAMRVLEGERESTFFWEQFGRKCRGTPDVRGATFHTELKTGETADPRRFPWKMRQFCYHGQLAFYSDGAAYAGLNEPEENYVVAVEASAPFVVTVFKVTARAIEQGRRLIRLWFEQLAGCEAADHWPGYTQSVTELDLPDADMELEDAGEDE